MLSFWGRWYICLLYEAQEQYHLAKGFINHDIVQKEVFYSFYYTESIYFHHFHLAVITYKSARVYLFKD